MKKITLILIGIILFSCSETVKNDTAPFNKEISTWKDGRPNLAYQLTQQKREQLNLINLEDGFDSLQIRIWCKHTLVDIGDVYIFKYKNSKWEGFHYFIRVDWDNENLTENVIESKKTQFIPKSGWSNFTSNLFENKITTLPDMREIEGLEDSWHDGINYNIEIATEFNYRFYSYHLPEKFIEFWQAKNMVEIINLIEEEI